MNNKDSILIKILAGEGGKDSWLFASDLAEVYLKFSKSKGFSAQLTKNSKEITLDIHGLRCYNAFKNESGIHRVQRIPPTEAKGRVHTSIINVIVSRQESRQVVGFSRDAVTITYYRDSGAGGQHRNKTMSGVRLQYDGEIIECCEERSQHRNKELAFSRLYKRLAEREEKERRDNAVREENKQNKNKGKRGNFKRNYNFQRNEISQDGKKYSLKEFMKGKINIIR